jgi:hypothetical protein
VKGSLKVTRAFGAGFLKQVSSYLMNCISSAYAHDELALDDHDHAMPLA